MEMLQMSEKKQQEVIECATVQLIKNLLKHGDVELRSTDKKTILSFRSDKDA
jgi:hypothetical protein